MGSLNTSDCVERLTGQASGSNFGLGGQGFPSLSSKKTNKQKIYSRISEKLIRGVRQHPGMTAKEILGRVSEKVNLGKIVSINLLSGNLNSNPIKNRYKNREVGLENLALYIN